MSLPNRATHFYQLLSDVNRRTAISDDDVKDLQNLLADVAQSSVEPQPQVLPHQGPNPINPRVYEPKISQPEYFSGDRKKLNEFITQLKMVISIQPSRFPTQNLWSYTPALFFVGPRFLDSTSP
jgi:hypothetical protein